MHGPDGTNYENKTIYLEVDPYQRLVYDHGGNDSRPPLFRVTVLFTELQNKTKMDMTMTLPTPEEAEQTRKLIKDAGGNSTWDRLAEYLTKQSEGKEVFVINRSFSASIETMFAMWTDPQHFINWLPPKGFSMEFIKCNLQAGGSTFYRMTDDSGLTMFGKTSYLEISPHHRIVYTQQFCDEHENTSRHPHAPLWPEMMLTTITLSEESNCLTRVTVAWECHGSTTKDELAAFIKEKGGMTMGWTGSFDKLDAYLAEQIG
jgi:uncharacterized protein YndB with AHSA1/START domain